MMRRKNWSIRTHQEMTHMTVLADRSIKIVLTVSQRFKKLKEKINVWSRDMEDIKDGTNWTSRNENCDI